MLKKNQITASSMANAIFICLIISILCSCLVFISHYQSLLEKKLEMKNHLINRNNSSFTYFLNNLEILTYNEAQQKDLFDDGIYSYVKKKNWGFYDILISKTIFKNDTISKIALVGERRNLKNRLALYVTNYDKTLKLSGRVNIYGDIKVPNGITEQTYVNNKIKNKVTIKGRQQKSKNLLPKISKPSIVDFYKYKSLPFQSEKFDTIINSFDNETKVYIVNNYNLDDITGKGNIIFASNNELRVGASAKLNDVLIIAPRVTIDSGFKGSLQIIAKQEVVINENVSLLYPSSIYIENDKDSVLVKVEKNSTVIGGIIINGKTYSGSLKRTLEIDEYATVVGDVYSYGRTQLKGKIIGSIYTDRFYLKTRSSRYENMLFNAIINKDSLPKPFIGLNLFNADKTNKEYACIKTF